MKAALALALIVVALGSSCEDLRQFSGTWAGSVSDDPALRRGFAAGASIRAQVDTVSRAHVALTVDLPDAGPPLAFLPIQGAIGDALGQIHMMGDPLRTYLGYLAPPDEQPYLTVVSLYADDRIEVRVIRGPEEVYGVFELRPVR